MPPTLGIHKGLVIASLYRPDHHTQKRAYPRVKPRGCDLRPLQDVIPTHDPQLNLRSPFVASTFEMDYCLIVLWSIRVGIYGAKVRQDFFSLSCFRPSLEQVDSHGYVATQPVSAFASVAQANYTASEASLDIVQSSCQGVTKFGNSVHWLKFFR